MRKKVKLGLLILTVMITLSAAACSKQKNVSEAMPKDFAFSYTSYVYKENANILDTYEEIIQRDLISAGVARKSYSISKADLEKIYAKIKDLGIDKMKQTMTSKNLTAPDKVVFVTPCSYYKLHFTMNGEELDVSGDGTAAFYKDSNKEADRFYKFVTFMDRFLEMAADEKAMPKPVGGYQ